MEQIITLSYVRVAIHTIFSFLQEILLKNFFSPKWDGSQLKKKIITIFVDADVGRDDPKPKAFLDCALMETYFYMIWIIFSHCSVYNLAPTKNKPSNGMF